MLSCKWGIKHCRSCHDTCRGGNDEPLLKRSRAVRRILKDGRWAARRLSGAIQHDRLRLSIVCDTLDRSIAKSIISLLVHMPTLAECAVRLGQALNCEIRQVAESAVLRVTARQPRNTPFRFPDLPEELQMQILSHTDLVAPDPIRWSSG